MATSMILERARSRPADMAPLDVRVLDHLVAPIEPLARVFDNGAHGVLAGRRPARRHVEADRPRFVLAREPHGYGLGRGIPSRGQIQRDHALGRFRAGVGDGHTYLARGTGADGDDRDFGRHGDGEARRHLELHPLLAGKDVVDVAVPDGLFHRNAGPVQLHVEGRPERSRTEREPEGHVGVESVAVGSLHVVPMDAGGPGAGGNSDAALAEVHAGRGERLRAAGGGGGEAGQSDAADGHLLTAVIRGPQGHVDRLAWHDHPVVRERGELHRVGEQRGAFELPFLGCQTEPDLSPGLLGQPEVREQRAQLPQRLEAGYDRRPRSGHPLRLEPLERLARAARHAGQRAHELARRVGTGETGEPLDRRVHAVEQRGLVRPPLPRKGRLGESVTSAGRAGRQRDQLGGALTLVHAARATADLGVGGAEQRVVAAEVHGGQVRIRRRAGAESRWADAHAEREPDPEVELLRLPGLESRGDLVREAVGVRRGVPRLVREHRRRLVMLAAAAPLRRQGGDDVRADGADHPDEVAEDFLPSPALEGLLDAEGVPEVDGAAEVLLCPVQTMRRVQLLGTQNREGVEQLRSDLVLAAVAARRRQQYGAVTLTPGEPREERIVLVVGMGRDHHEDAGAVELAQGKPEGHASVSGREGLRAGHGPESACAEHE